MINFTRAFDLAWERMHVILFRPFHFGKWCAIGLSAFLAGFLQGGNGFNGSFNTHFKNNSFPKIAGMPQTPSFDLHQFNSNLSHAVSGMQTGLVVLFALLIFAFFFAFILLLYWLGARGQFMFLDNIVRNRGAISWPWHQYRREANSLFFFQLIVLVLSLVVFAVLGGIAAVLGIPLFMHHRWPDGGEMAVFILLGLIYLGICIVFGFILFVFREFGVPLMFRNGLMAYPAFLESMNLIKLHTGTVILFVLLRIAIFIGVVILSLILCCGTLLCCCLSQWPYVGTVLLLPALVYVKCFSLDCLAQFGPQYDVWTVDVPPGGSPGLAPKVNPTPPPPLG